MLMSEVEMNLKICGTFENENRKLQVYFSLYLYIKYERSRAKNFLRQASVLIEWYANFKGLV